MVLKIDWLDTINVNWLILFDESQNITTYFFMLISSELKPQ